MSLTSIATRGYLCEAGNTLTTIATRGYLGCTGIVPPIVEPPKESTVKGGRGKKKRDYVYYDDEILAIIKAFVKCQDEEI